MPISQNLLFSAAVPTDPEFPDRPGEALLRGLSRELAAAGWGIGAVDLWRDCGWSLTCQRASSRLEVVVSDVSPDEWLLQISPWYVPGIVGLLFGKRASASPEDVYDLAVAVHRGLLTAGYLGRPRWLWDGFPDDGNASSEPVRPANRAGT